MSFAELDRQPKFQMAEVRTGLGSIIKNIFDTLVWNCNGKMQK